MHCIQFLRWEIFIELPFWDLFALNNFEMHPLSCQKDCCTQKKKIYTAVISWCVMLYVSALIQLQKEAVCEPFLVISNIITFYKNHIMQRIKNIIQISSHGNFTLAFRSYHFPKRQWNLSREKLYLQKSNLIKLAKCIKLIKYLQWAQLLV